MISASFAPALLERGIASTRRVLEQWWRDGVTDAELSARKKGLVGSYEVGLSTTGGLAGAILVRSSAATVSAGWMPTPTRSRLSRATRSTAPSTRGSTQPPWCWWRQAASRRHPRRRRRRRASHRRQALFPINYSETLARAARRNSGPRNSKARRHAAPMIAATTANAPENPADSSSPPVNPER